MYANVKLDCHLMEQIPEIEFPAPVCSASGQKKSSFDQLEVINTDS